MAFHRESYGGKRVLSFRRVRANVHYTSKHRVWSPKRRLARNIPETFKDLGLSQQTSFCPQKAMLATNTRGRFSCVPYNPPPGRGNSSPGLLLLISADLPKDRDSLSGTSFIVKMPYLNSLDGILQNFGRQFFNISISGDG